MAHLDSTIVFDPIVGCEDAKTATDRDTDLISGADAPGDAGGDRAFWQGQAIRVLSGLLHAAALGGASMSDVQRWVADPDMHAAQVQQHLRASKVASIRVDALQFVETNDRTRSSITSTIMPALGWLNDPHAAAAAGQTAGPGPVMVDGEVRISDRASFDVAQLLADRGTVYMLGAEDAQVAPLLCALTGHIARTARALANDMPGGRLDPALTLALDEAALIAPIPLDKWTSDMGGRNITIHIAVQSRAQLKARWGDTGAATIITNAGTMLVFGATDADDLDLYAKLAGERHERTHTHDRNGRLLSTTTQRVPVLTPADFSQLAKLHVVIFRPGLAPALGRIEPAYKRRDVKTVARQDARAARRIERAPVRAARRAIWSARWAGAKAGLDTAMTAAAAWIERTANGPSGEADRRVDPDA
jgi:type IV secretory pathway TraG/TraD family ATPase VirD4